MTDVIVIGGGPAGLTSALYLARAGKSVTVIEANAFGGQIVNSPLIENFPGLKTVSGFDFSMNLIDQVSDLNVNLESDKILGVEKHDGSFVLRGESGIYESRAVILATGAKCRELGLRNETSLVGNGISYCALCDGAFFKGKNVVVNGGGNTAIEDALLLSDYCNKVTVIHRRTFFRAEDSEVQKLKARKNVELILNHTVTELIGEDSLKGLLIKDVETGKTTEIQADGLFVAIGRIPDTEFVRAFVRLDDKGYVISGENCETETAGLFVAGDCRSKSVRQLTTAVSDGAVAAVRANEYLSANFNL